MVGNGFKRFTESARLGIKGEAFFESLIADHAIPHHIARQNDLGIDFLCEWIYGDRPSGILFLAQVKATTNRTVKPEPKSVSQKNLLQEFMLTRAKKVGPRTINYWKAFGLPAFLFYVIENRSNSKSRFDCYYKRYTPLLDGCPEPDDKIGSRRFYQVNEGQKFLAFADPENEVGGFAHDLIVDYARLSYSKGHIVPLTRRQLGFWPFEKKDEKDTVLYFGKLVRLHRKEIEATIKLMTDIINQLPAQTVAGSKTGIPTN